MSGLLRRDIRRMREAFPSWSSAEAVLDAIKKDLPDEIVESDVYTNSTGDITVTLDSVHIVIFPDDERPGLYCYGALPLIERNAVYVDANGPVKFGVDIRQSLPLE